MAHWKPHFLFVLFFLTLANGFAQSPHQILNQYLDTVSSGDPTRWSKVKTFYSFRFSTFGSMYNIFAPPPIKSEGSYTRCYKSWPDKMKEELYRDSLCTDLTAEFYYIKDKRYIRIANVPPMEAVGDNSMWFEFMPVIIQNHIKEAKSISYNGTAKLPGIKASLHEVEFQTKDKIRRFYFNTKTHLLEAMLFPEVNIFWFYSDYRNINGFLIPFYTGASNNGHVFSEARYKEMTFDAEVDEAMFKVK